MFSIFGVMTHQNVEVQFNCLSESFEILIDALASVDRKKVEISYREVGVLLQIYNIIIFIIYVELQIVSIGWDHSLCEVKFDIKRSEEDDSHVILKVPTSVELEHEMKLRFANYATITRGAKIPPFNYVGMFAGATKPKPFQRKRPNISKLPTGKLPPLGQMRDMAKDRHEGSYQPCPVETSRRLELAIQHIFEGYNTFQIMHVRGNVEYSGKWSTQSILLITEGMLIYQPNGSDGREMEIPFDTISGWDTEDKETEREKYVSGIRIHLAAHEDNPSLRDVYFGFRYVRDVKHTLEYFWNKHQVKNHRPVKLGSTHGRPLETVHTLSGEVPASESPVGQLDIVDSDGMAVRPGQMVKAGARSSIVGKRSSGATKRRSSLSFASSEPQALPHETNVKHHWRDIVKHQGWLSKQGGVGLSKQWIKRYFVLYSTSQGHFLMYYSDLLECPMYTTERIQRNVIDLAKTTFIRPGSTKSADTPQNAFDIQTIEREWTLSADNSDNAYRWLQMLTRAVDEDVAILPDEDLEFKVKAKVDPLGVFNAMDYSTSILVSANAVCVVAPDPPGSFNLKRQCFWVYTDFYKWSLLAQNGKLALLVNVFADKSFQKRQEFIFRTKDAVRLATAIEFFIEKFMTVMHIQLELQDPQQASEEDTKDTGKMAHAAPDQWANNGGHAFGKEVDLLGFEEEQQVFGKDPFGSSDSANKPVHAAPEVDFFGASAAPAAASSDGFGDDPFGFGGSSTSATMQTLSLTDEQIAQHKKWHQAATIAGSGPLYDDGTLQVAYKLEIRGSQGRLTFFYRNNSVTSTIEGLAVTVSDPANLLRLQTGNLVKSLPPHAQEEQQIMVECMTPGSPGPSLTVVYDEAGKGHRNNTIVLPLTVVSFNEPLKLSGADFKARWAILSNPGQEAVEVFNPSHTVTVQSVVRALGSVSQLLTFTILMNVFLKTAMLLCFQALKFFNVTEGVESEPAVLGAASLRTGSLNSAGEKITVGCLIKIEVNEQSNALRVTVRTVNVAATVAVMQTAKALLS
jgi:hypothetical protein